MKSKFFNNFYKSLEREVSPDYVKDLKKMIENHELDEDSLEKLIEEVI